MISIPVPNQPTLTATDSSNIEKTEHTNGDTVTLTCATVGADGYTFYQASSVVGSEKQSSNTLVITTYGYTNIGIYKCKAFNGDVEAQLDSANLELTLAGLSFLTLSLLDVTNY